MATATGSLPLRFAVVAALLLVHPAAWADETCSRPPRLRAGVDVGMCLSNEHGLAPTSICSETSIGASLPLGGCHPRWLWQATVEGSFLTQYTSPWRSTLLLPRVVLSGTWENTFLFGLGAQWLTDGVSVGMQGLLELGAPVGRLLEIGWRGAIGNAPSRDPTGDEVHPFALDTTFFARVLVP